MSSNVLEPNSIPIPPQLTGLLKQALGRSGTGFDEGAFLQQLHYWTLNSNTSGWIVDGVKWIYNSLKAWRSQFPWMSEYGLRKAIANLKKLGLIQTAQHWITSYQRVMFYRIDYDRLMVLAPSLCESFTSRCANSDHVDASTGRSLDPKTTSDTSFQNKQAGVMDIAMVKSAKSSQLPRSGTNPEMELRSTTGKSSPTPGSGDSLSVKSLEFPELIHTATQAIGQSPGDPLKQAIRQYPDRVKAAIAYLDHQRQRRVITNPAGYLHEAIIGDWKLGISNMPAAITPPGFKEWFDQTKKQGLVIAATAIEGIHHTLHAYRGWLPTADLMQNGQNFSP